MPQPVRLFLWRHGLDPWAHGNLVCSLGVTTVRFLKDYGYKFKWSASGMWVVGWKGMAGYGSKAEPATLNCGIFTEVASIQFVQCTIRAALPGEAGQPKRRVSDNPDRRVERQ